MNIFKNSHNILLAIFISFALVSCSNDDDKSSSPTGGTPPGPTMGTVSLTISGDVEGQRSGMADFDLLDIGVAQTWVLNMNDYSPQTFELSFVNMTTDGSASRPAPGTYVIGGVLGAQNVYWVEFSLIENQDFENAVDYSTFANQAGTLTILTSNEQVVSGTMEFTVHEYDDDSMEIISTITVTGSFSAKQRVF